MHCRIDWAYWAAVGVILAAMLAAVLAASACGYAPPGPAGADAREYRGDGSTTQGPGGPAMPLCGRPASRLP
jgi:hypothetical protein